MCGFSSITPHHPTIILHPSRKLLPVFVISLHKEEKQSMHCLKSLTEKTPSLWANGSGRKALEKFCDIFARVEGGYCLIWSIQGCAAGQGIVFVLSVLQTLSGALIPKYWSSSPLSPPLGYLEANITLLFCAINVTINTLMEHDEKILKLSLSLVCLLFTIL